MKMTKEQFQLQDNPQTTFADASKGEAMFADIAKHFTAKEIRKLFESDWNMERAQPVVRDPMPTDREIFDYAFKLIEHEYGWCQREMTKPVSPRNFIEPEEMKWAPIDPSTSPRETTAEIRHRRIDRAYCTAGAVQHAVRHFLMRKASEGAQKAVFDRIMQALHEAAFRESRGAFPSAIQYNDNNSHARVLRMWEHARSLIPSGVRCAPPSFLPRGIVAPFFA